MANTLGSELVITLAEAELRALVEAAGVSWGDWMAGKGDTRVSQWVLQQALLVALRTCPACGERKPKSAYYRSNTNMSGSSSHCKRCHNDGVSLARAKRRGASRG